MSESERGEESAGAIEHADGVMPGRFEPAAHAHEEHQREQNQRLGTHPAADHDHFIDQSAQETQLMVQPRNPSERELIHAYYEIGIEYTVSLDVMR